MEDQQIANKPKEEEKQQPKQMPMSPGQEYIIRMMSTLSALFEDCKNYGHSAFSRRVAYAIDDLQKKSFEVGKEFNAHLKALAEANGQIFGLKIEMARKESELKKMADSWLKEREEQSKFKNRFKNLFIKPKL